MLARIGLIICPCPSPCHVLISAASPIHNSNCSSGSSRSNHRHARSLPFPHVPSSPVPPDHGRISPLPRGAAVAALAVPQSRYLQKQFVESPGGNLHL